MVTTFALYISHDGQLGFPSKINLAQRQRLPPTLIACYHFDIDADCCDVVM